MIASTFLDNGKDVYYFSIQDYGTAALRRLFRVRLEEDEVKVN